MHQPASHSVAASGIWHTAAVLSDGLISQQTAQTIRQVYAPKAQAAELLATAFEWAELRHMVLFSSVAAIFGGSGQANYSASNSSLDALASCRRSQGRSCVSMQFGAWADVGMAARGAAGARALAVETSAGFRRIRLPQGLQALHSAFHPTCPSALGILPIEWSRFVPIDARAPPFISLLVPRLMRDMYQAQDASSRAIVPLEKSVIALVLDVISQLAGGSIDTDAPVLEEGLDSLGSIELRNQLQRDIGLALPNMLVFEHPTARQLAAFVDTKRLQLLGDRAQPQPAESGLSASELRADHLGETTAARQTTSCDVAVQTSMAPPLQPVETQPRLRCLCIHGHAGTGELLREMMEVKAWFELLSPQVEFVFADAPFSCKAAPEGYPEQASFVEQYNAVVAHSLPSVPVCRWLPAPIKAMASTILGYRKQLQVPPDCLHAAM